jgi:hypothetical protein
LFQALAIEAGVGNKFKDIRKRLSQKKFSFTRNQLHANETDEEKTTNSKRKNKRNKTKNKNKDGPKMVEMTKQVGKPMRRPTAEIFVGADIHSNPLLIAERQRARREKEEGRGGESGEVKTKARTSEPTVMGGFNGYSKTVLVGKNGRRQAAAKKIKEQYQKTKGAIKSITPSWNITSMSVARTRVTSVARTREEEEEEQQQEEEEENVVMEKEDTQHPTEEAKKKKKEKKAALLKVDKKSGRRYSVHSQTKEMAWVDGEDEVEVHLDEVTRKR